MKYLILLLICAALLLISGCVMNSECDKKDTYTFGTLNQNTTFGSEKFVSYEYTTKQYLNGYDQKTFYYSIVPDCENGVVFFNHNDKGDGIGTYGCRDCDIVKKYCPKYVGYCNTHG